MNDKNFYNNLKKKIAEQGIELPPLIIAVLEKIAKPYSANEFSYDEQAEFFTLGIKSTVPLLIATIESSFQFGDTCNLNFEGQSYIITPDSVEMRFLKLLKSDLLFP